MKFRRLFSTLAACAGLTMLFSTGTAQAYAGDPEVYNLAQNTTNCPCTHYDNVDGTYFLNDAGGIGLRSLIYHGGKLVGKVEFHPYGEKLWVYDTANDGDSFHVSFFVEREVASKGFELRGSYAPPGTSQEVEYRVVEFDIPEGRRVFYQLHDAAGSDYFGSSKDGIA
ncbi:MULTISPECIES: hypothetical protein [unclassified Streptomyces]|uniref:hypothetical protein n=1 Tax=unclassified Streptomyces TaxID=2593676 RepID=UPI003700A86E